MKHILVLGAYGLLGSSLCVSLAAAGHNVLRQGRAGTAQISMNPASAEALVACLHRQPVDVIVNLIAATNVDQCEAEPQLAYRGNVLPVEAIVQALQSETIPGRPHLIHLSSDQVYDGAGPHAEEHVSPCNVYGLSKLAGEFAASRIGATILRTNFIGRSRCEGRTSLTDWLVDSLRQGKNITVFDDVLFSPLHVQTLCAAILAVIDRPAAGIFNLGSTDGASKARLAMGLAERLGLNRTLMAVGKSQDVQLRARRPQDMRLHCDRFARTFDFALPTFASQIDITAQEY
jgi:dTDP-4-dehydrorhamnose reductase